MWHFKKFIAIFTYLNVLSESFDYLGDRLNARTYDAKEEELT